MKENTSKEIEDIGLLGGEFEIECCQGQREGIVFGLDVLPKTKHYPHVFLQQSAQHGRVATWVDRGWIVALNYRIICSK